MTLNTLAREAAVPQQLFSALSELLECPETGQPIRPGPDAFVVSGTGKHYPVTDGIPNLFVPNVGTPEHVDVTELVKQFYEETPFPNYDDFDSRERLASKAKKSVFAAMLDDQIPDNAVVL